MPAHDPPDIPFRRAPMVSQAAASASRWPTNLHLAFDANYSARIPFGKVPRSIFTARHFNGTATRFICDFTGNLLWGNLPMQPWELARPRGSGFDWQTPASSASVPSAVRPVSFTNLFLSPGAGACARDACESSESYHGMPSSVALKCAVQCASPLLAVSRCSANSFLLPGSESAVAIRREKTSSSWRARARGECPRPAPR